MFSKANLINFVLFQAVWFGCVLGGGALGLMWPGLVAMILLVLSLANSSCIRQDILLVMLVMPVGWLLDCMWIRLGILDFGTGSLAPYWIVLLWLGVALTVNHSLSPLRDRPWIGAVVVGVFGPVTYLAGERLGAVEVVNASLLWAVSLSWAVLFFGVFQIARRGLERWSVEDAPVA